MPFALDSHPEISEISEALNYLLGNFGANLSADPNTGEIKGPTGEVIAYLYKYLAVKYADSADGVLNFSDSPTNREYYGLRNNNDAAESSNPADYIWKRVAGGFGLTKLLWYQTTGGRQTQFAVAETAPDVGWLSDTGTSIDLDIITSGTVPAIVESFAAYFTPIVLQVPRSGDPLTPSFTGISPQMYATDKGAVIAFSDAQTDTNVGFVNNTWRIGNSSTTGNGDISYTNITIGDPTDAGDFAQWPNPTAMSNSPAFIGVPVRYKNSLGDVSQAGVATLQLLFADPGAQGIQGANIDIDGYTSFTQNAGGAFTPSNATLSALLQNVISPTYSWAISGATPTSATTSSVVVTPTSSSTGVTVTLTVAGSNLPSPLSKTVNLPIVYDGATGEAGANGVMSAFPSIFIWTGSAVPPTRPATTSTYTWGTGAYTAPTGWSTEAPSNTTAGNYLWSITIPLNTVATTTTSTLNWTSTSFPIRSVAYNGANGITGLNGNRTAVLDMYRWSAIAPIEFPSGVSTYTWSTQGFTAPATPNGWSLTPPAPVSGQTLYVVRQPYADSLSTLTSSVEWSASDASAYSVSTSGTRTAFLELYQWSASAPTAFPSGTSTYTWATGSFTLPATTNGWARIPGAAAAGLTLWGCQVSLTTTGTSATSTVSWATSTAYGVSFGLTGSSGSATFLVTRAANDSSAPTNAEVFAVIGRNPVAGDIVTVSYNSANNAVVYRFTTSWITQTTYITGSLIVEDTITGDKIVANTITGTNIAGDTITGDKIAANTITGENIVADSITVDKISSGQTTAINGGYFGLGVGTLYGYTSIGRFDMQSGTRTALTCTYSDPAGNGLAGLFVTRSADSWGTSAYYATTNTFNAFATTAVTGGNVAGLFKYNQSITTDNNLLLPPRSLFVTGGPNWGGIFDYLGDTGTNGTRTAVLDMYQWSSTSPAIYPVGSSTYTWATAQFTDPATLNGWTQTPGSGVSGQTLWMCRTVYADSGTSSTTSITWTASSNTSLGVFGAAGSRTAVLELYLWASTTPTTFPSGTSSYTWASGSFTAPSTPNGWSVSPGASTLGFKLYACRVVYSDTASTSTTTITWSTSTAYEVAEAAVVSGQGTYSRFQAINSNFDSSGIFTYFSSDGVAANRIRNAPVGYAAFAESIASNNKIYSADGYLPFTGVHDGLYEGDIEIGDIVVDYILVKQIDISNTIMQYNKSSVANQKGAIGVCSKIYDKPPVDWDEFFIEQGSLNTTNGASQTIVIPNPQYVPIPANQRVVNINALGEGAINVCGEGGNIEIGDLIVTSSIPGKGMKQSDDIIRSTTVAKSRQAVTFSSSADIQQIACIYLGG
jgi:hypothetical protein